MILPKVIDNTYRGQKAALWLFGALMFMKIGMSVSTIFNGRTTATNADGIPLDSYPAAAAQTIVALFAIFGLAHFVLCVIGVLVLVRYRSMVPFLFALLLVEHLARRLLLSLQPIVRTGHPPASMINYALLALMAVGLGLSLWRRDSR